jgi:hypothetical protein
MIVKRMADGSTGMRKVFVCVFQFRCPKCWSTNLIRRILRAETVEEARNRVHDGSVRCGYCRLPLPGDAEVASEISEPTAEEIEVSVVEPDPPKKT